MKCEDAREAMQMLMDDENCPNMRQAREHLAECIECREWKFDMDAITTTACELKDNLPDIDISAAVMARLPERHPASAPYGAVDTEWTPKKLLVWTAICWISGAALIIAGLGIWMLLSGTSFASLPPLACSFGKSFIALVISITTGAFAILRSTAPALNGAASEVFGFAVRIKLFILLSVATDTALLIIGCGLWRRRKISTGPLGLL